MLPAPLVVECGMPESPELCASWRLGPGESVDLPMVFILARAAAPLEIRVALDGSRTGVVRSLAVNPVRIDIDDRGFTRTTTAADPIRLWYSVNDKKQRGESTVIVFRNTGSSTQRVYFQVDAPSPGTSVRAGLMARARQVRLVNCPMVPGVCGELELPPAAEGIVPAALLDSFATTAAPQLTVRGPEGRVPPVDTATLALEVEDPAKAVRQRVPYRAFDGESGAVVPLDNTGIADWDYLNARKAPLVVGASTPQPGVAPLTPWTVLGFENRTVDRTFVVAVPVNGETGTRGGKVAAAAEGLKIEPCKHVADTPCAILSISPGTTKTVPLARLIDGKRPIVRFQLNFFEEDASPAYPTGYVRTSTAVFENPSRAVWSLFGRISGSFDPELPKDANGDDVRITETARFGSRTTASMSGVARLNLKSALGDRAEGDVDLLFKQTVLGGIDQRIPGARRDLDPVSVAKYRMTIFAQNGLQFSFGKFPVLDTPVLSESGDGFGFSWRNFRLSRILKRESAANVPDTANDDSDVWIGQANNLLARGGPLRSINLTAIRGSDRRKDNDRKYWTAGAEAFIASPTGPVQGSGGVFYSRRDVDGPTAAVPDGEGVMGYGTLTWSILAVDAGPAVKLKRSLSTTVAFGTADRVPEEPGAADVKNEGYFGESARFAPDTLFLASFDSRLGEKPPFARHSLSGKSYFSAAYTEERHIALMPLAWIAAWLTIPDSDIVSRRVTLRVSQYRYVEPLFGTRNPGFEVSYDNTIETPRGVRVGLTVSKFFSSDQFDRLFRRDPWRLVTFVQVQM